MPHFKTEGHVNFPTDSKKWTHNGENGLSVYLVVEEEDKPQAACAVNPVHLIHDEVFLDAYPKPLPPDENVVKAKALDDLQNWARDVAEFRGECSREAVERVWPVIKDQTRRWLKRDQHIPNGLLARDLPTPETDAEHVRSHVYETLSREYAAVLRMGSTKWVGTTEDFDYWICTPFDLTEEGLDMFAAVQKMYPDATLRLLTCLDT